MGADNGIAFNAALNHDIIPHIHIVSENGYALLGSSVSVTFAGLKRKRLDTYLGSGMDGTTISDNLCHS